jgi:hypothetical protein
MLLAVVGNEIDAMKSPFLCPGGSFARLDVSAWPAGENTPSVAFKNTIGTSSAKIEKKFSAVASPERVADKA